MSIVRLVLGRTDGRRQSPAVTESISSTERYYMDFEAYLVGILGFAHMAEASNGGGSTRYRADDTAMIGCKQSGAEWYWRAAHTESSLTANIFTSQLFLQQFSAPAPAAHEVIPLGAMNALMFNLGQSLGTNYFERNQPAVKAKFGDKAKTWPDVWNFGRVVRNAMSHRGEITFTSPNADPVSWKGLTYSPSDNGRRILHTDIWPGDLFDLIIEMDSCLS
ncbi:hypothetical protein Hrubri_4373 [Herbaspirillum rubrisubalbicans M1]|uniref:hypothetical protein n=1 Tax=Herbaspirillum rubrisubalbicans TaxID=80842 RepID=UPI00073ACD34|nr:hypothetical protein [Herbaspirillum rubrisubalbicans]ALU91518.1 hypothetical protein Hrubri_4373 [Herbaspirillum rubrisubalbicans M1]